MKQFYDPSPAQPGVDMSILQPRRCIVTGADDPRSNTWHHLDEDPSNSVFVNSVPLVWGVNSDLGEAFSMRELRKSAWLEPRLSPQALQLQAALHSSIWENAAAYGCSRLAAFIADKYLNESSEVVLEHAYFAHLFARLRFNYALLTDTLERSILPHLLNPTCLSPRLIALLLRESVSLYSEHGELSVANELTEILAQLEAKARAYLRQNERAGIQRRVAMNASAIGESKDIVERLYREAQDAAPSQLNFLIGGNIGLCWDSILRDDCTTVLDLCEATFTQIGGYHIDQNKTPNGEWITLGNIAELYKLYGMAILAVKDRRSERKGLRFLNKASDMFTAGGARPFNLVESIWFDAAKSLHPCYHIDVLAISASRQTLPNDLSRILHKVTKELVTRARSATRATT